MNTQELLDLLVKCENKVLDSTISNSGVGAAVPSYTCSPFLHLQSLPTPAVPSYTCSPFLHLQSLPTPAVPSYTCSPFLHLQSLPTPAVPSYTCSPFLHLQSLPTPAVPSYTCSPFLHLQSLPTPAVPSYTCSPFLHHYLTMPCVHGARTSSFKHIERLDCCSNTIAHSLHSGRFVTAHNIDKAQACSH